MFLPSVNALLRLKVHGSPCVVLVINDNLYGLIFALSYTCRICPQVMLVDHMLVERQKEEEWDENQDDQGDKEDSKNGHVKVEPIASMS